MQGDPTLNLGFILTDTARLLRRNFNRRTHDLGLTRAQWGLLTHLRRKNGLRQTDLACLMELQPISLTRLIDRMVKNGWVERRADPEDRRTNRIFLTEKVKPVLGRLQEIGRKTREEAQAGISQEERDQLLQLLLRIRANLAAQTPGTDCKTGKE
jgi:DNA-binding MarR family transcriptional regulator